LPDKSQLLLVGPRVLFIGGHDPVLLHPSKVLINGMRKGLGGNYF